MLSTKDRMDARKRGMSDACYQMDRALSQIEQDLLQNRAQVLQINDHDSDAPDFTNGSIAAVAEIRMQVANLNSRVTK